jgi:endoribonuclease LACTB2
LGQGPATTSPTLRPFVAAKGVEVFPARTPTLLPATHTNSYALGTRDVLLVEPATPYADEQRAWLDWARGLVSQGRTLTALFATHHHGDHVGGAEFLARELGLPLWAHRATHQRLPELPIDRYLEDGELIVLDGPEPLRFTALHTPGHAPGHLCLHEPETGVVVVGDMVASIGTILIERHDGDMAVYLEQLARLSALGATLALPAHGEPIENPSETFDRYIAHRRMREAKVLAALRASGQAGAMPADLVPAAYDDTPRAIWAIAQMSLEAHLIKLVRDGLASASGERYIPS